MSDESHEIILKRLIGFPSVSSSSNLDLIHWIANYLDGYGVVSRLSHNRERTKANLFATIGEVGRAGLVLSGHSDVVPVEQQRWTRDPFRAELLDGRLYGRGSCDMKGFIAVVLGLVPDLVAAPAPTPLHLALTFDEEIGCQGVRTLLADLESIEFRPRACLVGEPTEMRVVTAHKGAGMYACEVQGAEVHSSLGPRGANAVYFAARIIGHIETLAATLAEREPGDSKFDIPHSTIQVNQIHGGTAGNIVAGRCRFTIDIRHLPSTRRETLVAEIQSFIDRQILPALREKAPQGDVRLHPLADIPPFTIDEDAPIVGCVRHALQTTAPCVGTAFATEAGFFQGQGITTVICGPGSIEQAHRADEFVTLAQLEACSAMLRRLADSPAIAGQGDASP